MSTPAASARPHLVIVGPTGSGKSDAAMAMVSVQPEFEIVVVDAMQVYRGMDIGTGKPTAHDRVVARHHCLDLVEPTTPFGVTMWLASFAEAEAQIAGRSGRGLLVAGTGLYLRAAIDRFDVPGTWPDVRAELLADARRLGVPALHARLAELDPTAAARMEPGNERRVVRALEVTVGSGRRFSSFGPGVEEYPDNGVVQLGLRWSREVLAERIDRRVATMIDSGWVDEVADLLASDSLGPTASQALGYREIADHLRGGPDLDETIALIRLRTRQYAVRQERWFRRDPRIAWVELSRGADVVEAVLAAAEPHL